MPPINADRKTFASATTGGSEIAEDLLLGHAASRALRRDLGGQAQEHFPAEVVGKLGCVPRKEEAGGLSVAGVGASGARCSLLLAVRHPERGQVDTVDVAVGMLFQCDQVSYRGDMDGRADLVE